jgi:putative tryptophan/tyrosine transport system substrate-binding protein
MAIDIGRRQFISALGGTVVAWPLVARAQQPKIPMIGFLLPGSMVASKQFFDGFPLGMQEKGYLEGRDYVLESRYADGEFARLPPLADELVRLEPSVIVASTSAAALAVKQATANIPIVGVNLVDPVGTGLVKSEARPGTNITGTLQYLAGLTGKQLELARDLVPGITKIGVLGNVANTIFNVAQRGEAEAAAAKLGLSFLMLEIRTADEIGPAFKTFVQERANVVLVLRDILFLAVRRQIAAFTLAAHLSTIYAFREHVESGGLLSYGIDLRASYMRAAFYVDKILKGEKPADLPIEFPTKLELVINLTTAKALGITVPSSLLTRADEVIE